MVDAVDSPTWLVVAAKAVGDLSSVSHHRRGDVAEKSAHRSAFVDAKTEIVGVVDPAAVVPVAEDSAALELEVLLSFFGDLSWNRNWHYARRSLAVASEVG